MIGLKHKISSAGWQRFADEVVERAGVLDDETAQVLVQAFAKVPRSLFVPEAFRSRAADDCALPIGYDQSTSKPSTVARMLALIGLRRGMRVLEIGCGSGYCSAVMAAAGAQVFTVEYLGLLAQRTRRLLDALNFQNVLIRRGDGRRGWSEHAPYDAIIVSVAFEQIESRLLDQLIMPGGRMVAPVGSGEEQRLTLWEARDGKVNAYQLESCRFVLGE